MENHLNGAHKLITIHLFTKGTILLKSALGQHILINWIMGPLTGKQVL